MDAYIEEEFLGKINNVNFNDKRVYQTTEYLLSQLEATKDISIDSYELTKDLKETIERVEEKSEDLNFAELERNAVANIGPEKTLTDFQLTDDTGNEFYKSEEFNAKLRNGSYEKVFVHGRNMDDEPLSISSRGMEHKLKAALIEHGVDEETISKFTGKHFYKEDAKDILKNIPHQTKKETQMMI